MFGAVRRDIFYEPDLSLQLDNLLQAINARTKLVTLANPNHTGTVISPDDVVKILEAAREKQALVMVDEAYYHFCDVTMVPYIRQYDNLVIIRTFSKAFGIAPLRVGYALGQKEVIAELYKVKLTHEITSISARFGEYLLDHLEIMEEQVAEVKSGIRFLERECRSLGLKTEETQTNFIFIELPPDVDGKNIVACLKERNICISGPFTKAPFHNHLRVTVGPEDQMRSFLEEFRQVFSRAQGGA
jgi:histidinol-phosphate aminotransferase